MPLGRWITVKFADGAAAPVSFAPYGQGGAGSPGAAKTVFADIGFDDVGRYTVSDSGVYVASVSDDLVAAGLRAVGWGDDIPVDDALKRQLAASRNSAKVIGEAIKRGDFTPVRKSVSKADMDTRVRNEWDTAKLGDETTPSSRGKRADNRGFEVLGGGGATTTSCGRAWLCAIAHRNLWYLPVFRGGANANRTCFGSSGLSHIPTTTSVRSSSCT